MIQAIVTDIEGTTSSLSFVKDVLFPYARKHLPEFVHTRQQEPAIADLLMDARCLAGSQPNTEQLIEQFLDWIDRDQKITPLKSLQGLIWQAGYQAGDFKGHVYADAARQLKSWHHKGYALFVYSSGSVQAQKLLFSHSEFGDLTPLFTGYFDTHIGGKKEADSYRRIAEQTGYQAGNMLFLSDILEELDAAREAGFQTCWLVRESLPTDRSPSHPIASDFDAIPL